MSWKTKKIKHSKYCFYPIYSTVVVYSTGHFVKVQLNRLLAFSPKTITASEQNKFQANQWQLVDAGKDCVTGTV
jgi:hypothetical protein